MMAGSRRRSRSSRSIARLQARAAAARANRLVVRVPPAAGAPSSPHEGGPSRTSDDLGDDGRGAWFDRYSCRTRVLSPRNRGGLSPVDLAESLAGSGGGSGGGGEGPESAHLIVRALLRGLAALEGARELLCGLGGAEEGDLGWDGEEEGGD